MTSIDRAIVDQIEGKKVENVVFDTETRYCWVDEDGMRVSPVHKHLAASLHFIAGWKSFNKRIEARARKAQEALDLAINEAASKGREVRDYERNTFEYEMKMVEKARRKLSLTGKPPDRIVKIAVAAMPAPLNDMETGMVNTMWEAEFGSG